MLWEIRRQVAMQGATTASSWQELWNTATSAAPGHPGELRFYAMTKCSNCHGRRIDMRLGTACHTCMGRGKTNTQVRFTAVYAPVPET
jgi:DnaJ-class molecular chaperone